MLHRHQDSLDHDGIAGHFMHTDFARLSEAAPLPDVAQAMDRGHVDELPVTRPDGEVTGVVRREDLPGQGAATTAGDVAHHDFAYARYDEPIAEVLAEMRAAHLSALPVVTAEGRALGLVLRDELEAALPEPTRARRLAARARLRTRQWILPFGVTADDALPAAAIAGSASLITLALLGITYGGRPWLTWVDAAAALVAGIAAATFRSFEFQGAALSAFLSVVLSVLFVFGRATGVAGWLNWLHLLFALGFAALTALSVWRSPRLQAQKL